MSCLLSIERRRGGMQFPGRRPRRGRLARGLTGSEGGHTTERSLPRTGHGGADRSAGECGGQRRGARLGYHRIHADRVCAQRRWHLSLRRVRQRPAALRRRRDRSDARPLGFNINFYESRTTAGLTLITTATLPSTTLCPLTHRSGWLVPAPSSLPRSSQMWTPRRQHRGVRHRHPQRPESLRRRNSPGVRYYDENDTVTDNIPASD